MSDMRFIIIGVLLVFAGFLVLGIFGENYQTSNIESSEFESCFEYSDDREPISVECSEKILEQRVFFGFIIGVIICGILALLKGIRGDWDSRVKPEDMVGPSRDNRSEGNES